MMIKFFRLLRQQQLSEHKFSKYLLYAVGEIILVVIGILIALQVNNFNDSRKNAKNTTNNLSTLKSELVSNSEILKFNINVVKDQISNSLNLMDSLNNNDKITNKDLFLLDEIGKLGPLRIKSLTTTSLKDLINSSSYGTNLNGELKNNLLVYNSEIQNVDITLERFEVYWKEIELPYLTKHFSVLDMYTQGSTNSSNQVSRMTENTILQSSRKYFTNDLEAFFNNREFASMYTAKFAELRAVFVAMNSLDNAINDLIKSINTII